jgi:subtilisin-like proprotein convertase family protein
MKKCGILAAVAGLALAATGASAQVYSVTPGLAVPPGGIGGTPSSNTVVNIEVAGAPASITDLNVIINLPHVWVEDLDMTLFSPDGTSYVKLSTDNGGGGDNYTFTRFDDLSSTFITAGTAPFAGNFRPEGGAFGPGDPWTATAITLPPTALANLGGLNGTDPNGTWTLVLHDDFSVDNGTIIYASLEFNGAVDPNGPPPLTGPQPPQVVMTLDTTSGVIGTSIVATCFVTPGTSPPSTGLSVTLDATAIDGGSITLLDNGVAPDGVAGDNVFTGTAIVGPGAAFGNQNLIASVTDAQARGATAITTFSVIPPAPSNDDCATPIEVFDGSNAVSNVSATSDGSTVCVPSSFEVYYTYTATSTNTIRIDMCSGATFDTVLAVYDTCDGLPFVCNDDFCGLRSQLEFSAVAGQTYIIRLASYGSFSPFTGTGTMTIGVPGPTDPEGFAFANPDPVLANESTLLQVFVTPGTNPASTGLTVTMDTSALQGGSATQTLYDDGTNGDEFAGDNIFSFLQPIALEQAEQTYEFPYTITDAEARSFSGSLFLDVDVSNPEGISAGFTPQSGFAGTLTRFEAVIAPALYPDSTGIVVVADFAELNGSASQNLFDDGTNGDLVAGDNIFSYAITIDPTLTAGDKIVRVTSIVDAEGRFAEFLPGDAFTVRIPAQWEELTNGGGDAGDLVSTGQVPSGSGTLGSVGGELSAGDDADLFLINICDVSNFVASTFDNGSFNDTALFIFAPDGTGVVFNDDVPLGFPGDLTLQSRLSGALIPSAGNYYLGVARWDFDPVDEVGGFIWEDQPYRAERAPDAGSATNILAGWVNPAFAGGSYRVDLTGACYASGGPNCNYDFNQDENVDLLDAQQMAQVFVGLITPGANWLDGDLNGDENADLTDAQILAAFVVSGNCNL